MEDNTKISELMNYETVSSNSSNYVRPHSTSCPESFPNIMENGILIEFNELDFASLIVGNPVEIKE